MCEPVSIAAAAVAVSATSAVVSYSQQQDAANAQAGYNAASTRQANENRAATLQYQNQVWQQDIEYANDMLAWSEQEWSRQVKYDGEARAAVEKNTLAQIGQVMLRQVEEDMSVILQGTEVRRQGTVARASMAAKDRGVEGNSVDAILNDVYRQEGEAINVMAMNRSASARQLNREAIQIDAQGDQQLASIQLKTYAPQAPVRSPSPVAGAATAAPVAGANVGQLITGVAGSVSTGINTYSAVTGQTNDKTINQAVNWASSKLSL